MGFVRWAFLDLTAVAPLISAQARDGTGCQVFPPAAAAGALPWFAPTALLWRSQAAIDWKFEG
nr:E423 [uncultured bacterium]ART39727.1 J588 [uncultured bacterium]